MKTYPPRQHDKKKRVSRAEFPRFVLHMKPDPRSMSPRRDRKGCITIIRPE